MQRPIFKFERSSSGYATEKLYDFAFESGNSQIDCATATISTTTGNVYGSKYSKFFATQTLGKMHKVCQGVTAAEAMIALGFNNARDNRSSLCHYLRKFKGMHGSECMLYSDFSNNSLDEIEIAMEISRDALLIAPALKKKKVQVQDTVTLQACTTNDRSSQNTPHHITNSNHDTYPVGNPFWHRYPNNVTPYFFENTTVPFTGMSTDGNSAMHMYSQSYNNYLGYQGIPGAANSYEKPIVDKQSTKENISSDASSTSTNQVWVSDDESSKTNDYDSSNESNHYKNDYDESGEGDYSDSDYVDSGYDDSDVEMQDERQQDESESNDNENSVITGDKIKFIELFAGIGGGSAAASQIFSNQNNNHNQETEKCAYQCVLASEIDKKARTVFSANFPEVPLRSDIKAIKDRKIPEANLVIAGFPCQSFSSMGNNQGFKSKNGKLFYEILRVLKASNADVVLLENVPAIRKYEEKIKDELEKIGYISKTDTLNSLNFGVSQIRKRWYLVGVRKDSELAVRSISSNNELLFEFPSDQLPENKTHIVYDALADNNAYDGYDPKGIGKTTVHNILSNHYRKLSDDVERITEEEKKQKMQLGQTDTIKQTKFFEVGMTKPNLGNNKHRSKGFRIFSTCSKRGESRAGDFRSDKDVPKIENDINNTNHVYNFFPLINPARTLIRSQPILAPLGRNLMPLESARIQGFPDNYILPPDSYHTYAALFGNAFSVPVIRSLLTEIAEQIFKKTVHTIKLEKSMPARDKIPGEKFNNKVVLEIREDIVLETKTGFSKNKSLSTIPEDSRSISDIHENFIHEVRTSQPRWHQELHSSFTRVSLVLARLKRLKATPLLNATTSTIMTASPIADNKKRKHSNGKIIIVDDNRGGKRKKTEHPYSQMQFEEQQLIDDAATLEASALNIRHAFRKK